MRAVPAELSRLDAQADAAALIVFCHHGVRSLNVVHWLREQGVDACQSMAGGIDRWSLEIDSECPPIFLRLSPPVPNYVAKCHKLSSSWAWLW